MAVVVRLAFVWLLPVNPMAGGDPRAFWSFAESIHRGEGFRSSVEPWLADRPPLYAYFVAGVFMLAGKSEKAVFAAQAVLGALAASLFFLYASVHLGRLQSVLAGIVFALLPHFLLFAKQILTETLFITLICLLMATLLVPLRQRHWWRWFPAGITLGLLALVRREAILAATAIVLVSIWLTTRPNILRTAKALAIVGVSAVLVVLPWLVRNALALGSPVLSSSGGWNFMVGNNPHSAGGYAPPPAEWEPYFAGLGELERDRVAWELSRDWIREAPGRFVRLIPLKLVHLLGPAHNLMLDGTDLVLLPVWVAGLWSLQRKRTERIMAVALPLVVCTVLIGVVFVGGWRYRLAAYPALLLLAANAMPESTLVWIWQRGVSGLRSLISARPVASPKTSVLTKHKDDE